MFNVKRNPSSPAFIRLDKTSSIELGRLGVPQAKLSTKDEIIMSNLKADQFMDLYLSLMRRPSASTFSFTDGERSLIDKAFSGIPVLQQFLAMIVKNEAGTQSWYRVDTADPDEPKLDYGNALVFTKKPVHSPQVPELFDSKLGYYVYNYGTAALGVTGFNLKQYALSDKDKYVFLDYNKRRYGLDFTAESTYYFPAYDLKRMVIRDQYIFDTYVKKTKSKYGFIYSCDESVPKAHLLPLGSSIQCVVDKAIKGYNAGSKIGLKNKELLIFMDQFYQRGDDFVKAFKSFYKGQPLEVDALVRAKVISKNYAERIRPTLEG